MAGSNRRRKKTAPKVRVGTAASKRKKTNRTKVPRDITAAQPELKRRLKAEVTWEKEKNLSVNYEANKLLMDANQGFGRNTRDFRLKSREEREQAGEEAFHDDDEMRGGCHLERSTGPPPPPRLTPKQRAVVEGLVAAHGEDVQAMVLDTRRNKMQHSAGQLQKMIASLQHWNGPKDRHDFRAPRKRPKKLF